MILNTVPVVRVKDTPTLNIYVPALDIPPILCYYFITRYFGFDNQVQVNALLTNLPTLGGKEYVFPDNHTSAVVNVCSVRTINQFLSHHLMH